MMDLFVGGLVLVMSILLLILAFYKLKHDKVIYTLIFILLNGLILRSFVSLDPYLHEWDEKYHALVAKNYTTGSYQPKLYEAPVHEYDFKNWTGNAIWLEKGPIPLWLIGVSTKAFGYTPFAVRIPSIILGTLAIVLTFLLGKRLFNQRVAIYASFLHSINGLIIEINGGRVSSDHVESLFIIFVELSFYFLVLFFTKNQNKTLWTFLMGVSVGLAVLTKWAPGLLVLPLFFILLIFKKYKIAELIKYCSVAILSVLIVTLPYFISIYQSYPAEFQWVMKKFVSAYNNTVESHQGPWWYYLNKLGVVFGEIIIIPLLFFIAYFFRSKNWKILLFMLWVIIPVFIFSFAETKRATYILIAAPACFMLIALFIDGLISSYKLTKQVNILKNKGVRYLLIAAIIILPYRYCMERVKFFSLDLTPPQYISDIQKMERFSKTQNKTIIVNFPHHIEAMFFTDYTVYPNPLSSQIIEELLKKDYQVIFYNQDDSKKGFPFTYCEDIEAYQSVVKG